MRLRDLGIVIGHHAPGARNTIADVAGVRVGHATVIHGDGDLRIGRGPARTGVTVVIPHPGDTWTEPRYAGWFALNGSGEFTGLHLLGELGLLYGNIYMTNTHSVGTVRDAVIRRESRLRDDPFQVLPVIGETFDGILNDIAGLHVHADHVDEALGNASDDVTEGNVGGGTGMICHGFKGGIGTSSRVLGPDDGGYIVGALVQANHGVREGLLVAGAQVGRILHPGVVPLPADTTPGPGRNSILIMVATDAPLLPHQCTRLAHRATLGVARTGGTGHSLSGDFALAFSTFAQRDLGDDIREARTLDRLATLTSVGLDPLFDAAVEATEEAVLNALVAAETLKGRDGYTAFGLDPEALKESVASSTPRNSGERRSVVPHGSDT